MIKSYKLDSTINLENRINTYILNNEIFWYNTLLLDLELNLSEISIASKYIKHLCSTNFIQPCDKKGNHTQYIKVETT